MAVISEKGGVWKSTVAVHLAVAATLASFRTALVDLDLQATARKWGDKREAAEPDVIGDHAERLPQLADAARANGADLVILENLAMTICNRRHEVKPWLCAPRRIRR